MLGHRLLLCLLVCLWYRTLLFGSTRANWTLSLWLALLALRKTVGQAVLEGIRKVEIEEGGGSLGLVVGTIPAERHTAYQDIQDREDLEDPAGRHDPNRQVEEDRREGIERAGQREAP